MLPTITVRAYQDGDDVIVALRRDDSSEVEFVELEESLRYRNHSPTGFSWGYNGSGPAQLAFAILQQAVGVEFAEHHYQRFKCEIIAWIPQSIVAWKATLDLQEWVASETNGKAFEADMTLNEAVWE